MTNGLPGCICSSLLAELIWAKLQWDGASSTSPVPVVGLLVASWQLPRCGLGAQPSLAA